MPLEDLDEDTGQLAQPKRKLINFIPSSYKTFGHDRPRNFMNKQNRSEPFTYRREPKYNVEKFDPIDPKNMLIELCLWKWARSQQYRSPVIKDDLMFNLFPTTGTITTTRVGRIIAAAVARPANHQFNHHGENMQGWSFKDPMDLAYGMEYMIIQWLPWHRRRRDGENTFTTLNEFRDELKFFEDQSYTDFKDYLEMKE